MKERTREWLAGIAIVALIFLAWVGIVALFEEIAGR